MRNELPRYDLKREWPAEWTRIRSNKRGWAIVGAWFLGLSALSWLSDSPWLVRAYGFGGLLLVKQFMPADRPQYSYSKTYIAVSMVVALVIAALIVAYAVAISALAGDL